MLTRLTGTTLWLFFSTPLLAECYLQSSKWLNVNTTSGVVQGHVIDNRPQVVEYLGVPYAKPPIEDLRFAPQKASMVQMSSMGLLMVSAARRSRVEL